MEEGEREPPDVPIQNNSTVNSTEEILSQRKMV